MAKLLMSPKRDLPSRIGVEIANHWVGTPPLKTSTLARLIAGAILFEREQCAREAEMLHADQVAAVIRSRPETPTQLQLDATLPAIVKP